MSRLVCPCRDLKEPNDQPYYQQFATLLCQTCRFHVPVRVGRRPVRPTTPLQNRKLAEGGSRLHDLDKASQDQLNRGKRWVEVLKFLGSLCTIPLAIGLYLALKPVNRSVALTALLCRLIEAGFGLLMTILGFGTLWLQLPGTHAGAWVADQLHRLDAMSIGVLSFSLGSAIFFYLFWKS